MDETVESSQEPRQRRSTRRSAIDTPASQAKAPLNTRRRNTAAAGAVTADGSSTGVLAGGNGNGNHNQTGDADGDGRGHARDEDHDDTESRKSSFSTRSIDMDHPPLDRRELNAWFVDGPHLAHANPLDARCEINPSFNVVRRPWPCILWKCLEFR